MIISSSRMAPENRHVEKEFSDLESLRSGATTIMRLTGREQQVANLLLEGCENTDIARQLGIAPRTVKAYFNRLYLRFGITSGVKRVKLATFLFRSQLCWQVTSGNAIQVNTKPCVRNSPEAATQAHAVSHEKVHRFFSRAH